MIRDDRDIPSQAPAMAPIAAARPASQTRGMPAPERPNVVLIQLDDLDAQSVSQTPAVQALLADEGASFANAFATTPLCASRGDSPSWRSALGVGAASLRTLRSLIRPCTKESRQSLNHLSTSVLFLKSLPMSG